MYRGRGGGGGGRYDGRDGRGDRRGYGMRRDDEEEGDGRGGRPSTLRGYFAENRDVDWMRDRYDPARLEAQFAAWQEKSLVAAQGAADEIERDVEAFVRPPVAAEAEAAGADGAGAAGEPDAPDAVPKAALRAAEPPAGALEAPRSLHDLRQMHALMAKLDGEAGVPVAVRSHPRLAPLGPADAAPAEGDAAEMETLLRAAGQYLWRVYRLDYYRGHEMSDCYVEGPPLVPDSLLSQPAAWQPPLDATWAARLAGCSALEAMLGRERAAAAEAELLASHVARVGDAKFSCCAPGCAKMFFGPEFVHKHIRVKHADLVEGARRAAAEAMYESNFLRGVDAKELVRQGQLRADDADDAAAGGDRDGDDRRRSRRDDGGAGDRDGGRKRGRDDRPGEGRPWGYDDGGGGRHEAAWSGRDGGRGGRDPYGDRGVTRRGGRLDGRLENPRDGRRPLADDEVAHVGDGALLGAGLSGGDGGLPMLVPVPGAGPLGPFIPVGREFGGQDAGGKRRRTGGGDWGGGGGPGGPGGRRGASDLGLAGMAPFPMHLFAGAPEMRQLRNYTDLDAPSDGVGGLDYGP